MSHCIQQPKVIPSTHRHMQHVRFGLYDSVYVYAIEDADQVLFDIMNLKSAEDMRNEIQKD